MEHHPTNLGLDPEDGEPEALDPVEELMVRCLDGPEEDWPRALDEATREHPELAEELIRRLDALVAFDAHGPQLGQQSGPQSESKGGGLPHERFLAPDRLGEFTRLEQLGSGGMGLVFRAYQQSLDREVALKIIRPERLFFESSLTRFQREVETVARLHHPGIVAIHSVGRAEDSELPFFAMELLEGATLSAILSHVAGRAPESLQGRDLHDAVGGEGDPPPAFAGSWTDGCVEIALQVGRALEHAHGAGVLHRDIKPSNIMLEPGGRAVLFDFGLTATQASAGERVTQTGHPVGTLVYMSPEQIEEDVDLDGRTDVYSLGVTLYELLTLQAPFAGSAAPRIHGAVLAGDVDPLRARNRRVSAELQTVVLQAMAVRRGDRYADARSLCVDLENVLERRPILARPPGALTRILRWIQRRPSSAAALALALCLLVGVPIVALVLSKQHARELGAVADQERAAKEAALEANAELEDVVAFTVGMFERARPDWNGGGVPDAREMLKLGAAELPKLRERPASEARIELVLGELFSTLADVGAAGPHLEAAIEHYGARDDVESRTRLARALRHSGHGLLLQRRFPEAKERLERALAAAVSVFGEKGPELHAYHATLADLYRDLHEFDSAIAERERALELLGTADGSDPRLARTRALLGVTLKDAGRLEEARPLLEAAIAWNDERTSREGNGDEGLGAEGPLFLLTLGDLEKLEGNLEKALGLSQRARAALEEIRGADDLLTAQAKMAEAEALARLERYGEALPVFSALGARLARDFPPAHPVLLRTRLMEIACLSALKRRPEIAPLCREHDLVARYVEVFGETHPNTRRVISALAASLQERGEDDDSLRSFRQLEAAERAAEAWSADHADAIFMLVSHRMKMRASDEENGPAATGALLQELLAAVEGKGLRAVSAISGEVYDVEATARSFLAALTGGR